MTAGLLASAGMALYTVKVMPLYIKLNIPLRSLAAPPLTLKNGRIKTHLFSSKAMGLFLKLLIGYHPRLFFGEENSKCPKLGLGRGYFRTMRFDLYGHRSVEFFGKHHFNFVAYCVRLLECD